MFFFNKEKRSFSRWTVSVWNQFSSSSFVSFFLLSLFLSFPTVVKTCGHFTMDFGTYHYPFLEVSLLSFSIDLLESWAKTNAETEGNWQMSLTSKRQKEREISGNNGRHDRGWLFWNGKLDWSRSHVVESEIFRARVLWGKFSPPMKNRSHFFLAVLRARTCMYLADLGLNRKSINQSSLPYPFQGDLHNRITVRINQNQHSTIFRKEKIFLSPEPI